MGRQTVTALGTLMALAAAFLGYEQTLGRLTDFEPIDPALLKPLAVVDEPAQFRAEDEIAAERAFGRTEARKLGAMTMYQVPKSVFSDAPRGRGLGLFIFFGKYQLSKDDDPKLVEFAPITIISITAKPGAPAERDEIYTLEADRAVVRFDRPVEIAKTPNAQPLAGWVEGRVKLRSNMGTANRTDDDVTVVTDRIDYEKAKRLIWSDRRVDVTTNDGMRVSGVGMEIELAPDKEAADAPAHADDKKSGKKKASDVERLRLLDDVDFHLLVEEEGQPLGGLGGATAATVPGKTTPVGKGKAPLDIKARGPFLYDVATMRASFDKSVVVERTVAKPTLSHDRLLCDRLLLQFMERPPEPTIVLKPGEKPVAKPAAAASPPPTGTLQTAQQRTALSTVEAFGPADTVVVISESQKLRAIGDHLFHDAAKKETRLRSAKKLVVLQENVRIEGRSLLITQTGPTGPPGPNAGGSMHDALVEGPDGLFEVTEKDAKGPSPPKELVVRFQNSLRARPEKDNPKNRMVDVDGGVELEVPKQPLLMTSELLHVRLEESTAPRAAPPASAPGKAGATPDALSSSKLEPTWIKAERSVNVSSPELDVAAGQWLIMHIANGDKLVGVQPPNARDDEVVAVGDLPRNDRRPLAVALPDADRDVTTVAFKPSEDGKAATPARLADQPPARSKSAAKAPAPGAKRGDFDLGLGRKERDPSKPPDKVDLRAETVEVFAVKIAGKTEARSAEAVGNVFIRRDPADKNPDDVVEIKGTRVNFFRNPKGDRMVVLGTLTEGGRPADIINKKFHLAECRFVDLDEGPNQMTVDGPGRLTLVGAGLANATDAPKNVRAADKPFVVTWIDKMVFDGLTAQFDGRVVTRQDSQRVEPAEEFVRQKITCKLMTVYFKERMSFRGARTESNRKMEVLKVLCDQEVVAIESIFRPPPGKEPTEADLFRYSGINATYMTMDNVHREVVASGTGSWALFVERAPPNAAQDEKRRSNAPALPFVRTEASFGRMTYLQDDKVVHLTDSVRTTRSPVAALREALPQDPDKLRPEAVCVFGDKVDLQEHADAEGRKQHDFKAEGTVQLQTREYQGFGDDATYDQSRDRFVLHGNPAILKKQAKPGVESPTTAAEQIEYFVKSGRTRVIGGQRAPGFDLGDLKAKGPGLPTGPKQKKQ